MTSIKTKNRKELLIVSKKEYSSIKEKILKMNIGSIYIQTTLQNLSTTRSELILDNFTTRLFVANILGENHFFIYGKKKANKGTFNEHCKNTVYEYENWESFYTHIISVSSNQNETVMTDNKKILRTLKEMDRKGECLE